MCRISGHQSRLMLGGCLMLAVVSCGLKTPLDSTPGLSTGAVGSGGPLAAGNSASVPDASGGPFRDTGVDSESVVPVSPDAKAGPDLVVAVLRDSATAEISPSIVPLSGPPGPVLPPGRDTADAGRSFPGTGVVRFEPDGGIASRGEVGTVFRGDGGFALPGGGGFALPGDGGFFVGGAGGAGRGGGAGVGAGRGGGAGPAGAVAGVGAGG